MQNYDHNLGELRSVHRPSTVRIWLLALVALGLLIPVLLGVLLTFDSFTSVFTDSKEGTFSRVSSPLICLSVSGLLLALIVSFLVKDFRKWSATRTAKLMIFQKGFAYESEGRIETCHWDEIKDITYRRVEVTHKHSPPRRVNLIRSIVKRDGEMISLADTLSLTRITEVITAARKAADKQRSSS
jgi:hypothetical protein